MTYNNNTICKYLHKMGAKVREISADVARYHVCITRGNRKIGRVLNVSLPPIFSCKHNCNECRKQCYDIKANMQYGNVLNARARNFAILLKDRDRYFSEIEKALSPRCKRKYFRWHVGGDIVDLDYLMHMVKIARKHPDWIFWSYTKQYDIVNAYIAQFGALPSNLSIMFSLWDNVPCDNPYHMPTFAAYAHDDKVPSNVWRCTGNCEICISCKQGCPYGKSAWTYLH